MIYQFNLSFSLSLLFMGFLLANIFGIITNSKNIIFLFVLCIELINYFVYSTNSPAVGTNYLQSTKSKLGYFSTSSYKTNKVYPTSYEKTTYLRSGSKSSTKKIVVVPRASLQSEARPVARATNRLENQFSTSNSSKNRFSKIYKFFSLFLPFENFKKLKTINHNIGHRSSIVISTIVISLNFLKIGFEFGFFIDAFKLGS